MNAAARCCVWYLLARFMRTLAQQPTCGSAGCYEQVQCWGIYTEKYSSLCDSHTDGGGWTILQQRHNSYVNFYRNCTEYKHGFGTTKSVFGTSDTFWLGLENLHRMTVGQQIQFRVEITYGQGTSKMYAVYDNVTIGDEAHDYALNYAVYNGTGGLQDGFRGSIGRFCCNDHPDSHCRRRARYERTGWWFSKRGDRTSNLNAELDTSIPRQSVYWVGVQLTIQHTQIKFRPMNAAKPKCDRSCPHGGICQRAADGTFLCRCELGRKGLRCDKVDYDNLPAHECFCFHRGWCTSAGLCSCRAGYTGMRCLKKSSMTHRKGKPDSRWVRLERTCR